MAVLSPWKPALPHRRGDGGSAGFHGDNALAHAGVGFGGVNDLEQAWDAVHE